MAKRLLFMPPMHTPNYEVEDRFRDRRGREHYDNGRYAPMNIGYMGGYSGMNDYGYARMPEYHEMEDRVRRDRRGRFTSEDESWVESREPRLSYGLRYKTSPRSEYDNGEDMYDRGERYGRMHHGDYPYVPPVYQRTNDRSYRTRSYGNNGAIKPMNKIGFDIGGEMERLPDDEIGHDYHSDASYNHMDEMRSRSGKRMSGYGNGNGYPELTKEDAIEWMECLENDDGTTGPHWSLEQAKKVMAQKGIQADPVRFWVALNLVYSDLSTTLKKMNQNNMDAYVDIAKAFWLNDRDYPGDKLAKYRASMEM